MGRKPCSVWLTAIFSLVMLENTREACLGCGRDSSGVLVELDHEAVERLLRAVGQLQQEHCAQASRGTHS